MTLIAATSNFGHPILIGDILTTSPSETVEREIEIPTHLSGVNHRLPPNQKLLPSNLRRKIYVVTDQLAVGLAGSEYDMKAYLDELRNYFKYKDVTEANVVEFWEEFRQEDFPECTAILLYATKTPEGTLITQRHFGAWRRFTSPLYGEVFACGSGSLPFLKHAGTEWKMPFSSGPGRSFQAIGLNYSLISTILGHEWLTLETIKNYWGASFEMIYYDGGRFRMMDDITIVLFKGTLDIKTGHYEVQPRLFFNYQYSKDGDILVINAGGFAAHKVYGVLPLYLRSEDVDESTLPQKAHFDAKKICLSYILETSERQVNGSEITVEIVAPTFFTETGPEADLRFVAPGQQNPFGTAGENAGIPNLGYAKVDVDADGNIVLLVQEGVTEQVIENMRQILLKENGSPS
jgi:hypothetical protein